MTLFNEVIVCLFSTMDKEIIKIFPRVSELSFIENTLTCPEHNCNSLFKCSSNLRMHLIKHHRKSGELAKYQTECQYYCPIEKCKYSSKSSEYFSKMKYLKQHFLKCHAPKEFACKKCDKKYSTQSMLASHSRTCGANFLCSCGWKYTSKEALSTHCKRKKHNAVLTAVSSGVRDPHFKITEKSRKDRKTKEKYYNVSDKTSKTEPIPELEINEEGSKSSDDGVEKMEGLEENTLVKVCIASPQHSKSPRSSNNEQQVFPTHYIAAIALSELSTTFIIPKNCHIGVQTVDTKLTKKTRTTNNDKNWKHSQETQTAGLVLKVKKNKICAETQTSNVSEKNASKVQTKKRKKTSETQTKDRISLLSSAKNDSLDISMFNESSMSDSSVNETNHKHLTIDDDSVWVNIGKKSSSQNKPFISSVNSNIFNYNKELTIGSQSTEFPLCSLSNFDINKLCNNETQTELNLLLQNEGEGTSTTETQTTDELMGDLLYSNNCTQTCDDVDEFFDFNFVDIETQTAWPDL